MSRTSLFKSHEGEVKYLTAYDAALARWPVPYQAVDVETSFGTTHINVSGAADSPPLLLLHAFGFSSTQWWTNVAPLSRDFRVYAPDVIDQPGRSVRTRPLQTRPDYAAWLVEVLDKLKTGQIFLVGHSFGGWLALNLALAVPERIKRMVLLSPAASFVPLVPQFYLRGMAANLIPIRPVIYSMLQWMTYTPLDTSQANVEQFVLAVQHFKMNHLKPPTVYSDDELRQITIPTLLLIGDHEVVCNTKKVLERAKRLMLNIETALVANGGHAFPVEQADSTNKQIMAFLKC